MANNPLDLKEFKHYLNFVNDGLGRIPISEPVKFDGSAFTIEQEPRGYARDITYMAEEVDLEFYSGFFEKGDSYELPNGIVTDKLGHAIDYLFRYNTDYGFQAQIEYILERNGVEFILGELNFEGAKTDELTYFYCKVVQNTKRALSKRREDTKIDGFATEDLDGNEVVPIQTQNILLKAKPVSQKSEWLGSPVSFRVRNVTSGRNSAYYNNIGNLINSQIDDSLSYIPGFNSPENLVYLKALNDLTNVKIDITVDITLQKYLGNIGTGVLKMQAFIGEDQDIQFDPLGQVIGASTIFQLNIENSSTETINDTINLNNITIQSGKKLFIWFFISMNSTGVFGVEAIINSDSKIEINATSTSISTVIKAVRYVDLIKQSLKVINGMEIISPDFEPGGKYYDLFAFSGNLIRQRDDVPFYITFKDRRENLALMNSDVQINENNAILVKYDKYYDNIENGVFPLVPDTKYNMTYNKKYAVNLFEFQFNNYEKDRDESNTLDAIHTKAQFSINNTRVKNTKKISISDTFDPFRIESIRRQQFKETTALDGDDKIHVIDGIQLAPGIKGGFTASMTHQLDENGNLKLLKDSNLPSWSLLGFNINDSFSISQGINIGSYTVTETENTIITLTPLVGTVPTDEGVALTTVVYNYNNVSLTNRTNEGFTLIENLSNSENFSNLRYSIRRNLIDWESYISTCAKYISDNPINTEFTNNGNLVTQFQGGETYTENGDIDLQKIQKGLLTPRLYETDVVASYDDVLDLISKYQQIETIGGFIRVSDNNGDVRNLYPQKLTYTWATKVLNIIGEERNESETININANNDFITINNVNYDRKCLNTPMYEMVGDYFAIYDNNNIKIINFTKYTKFIVQGENFENPYDLAQALIDL